MQSPISFIKSIQVEWSYIGFWEFTIKAGENEMHSSHSPYRNFRTRKMPSSIMNAFFKKVNQKVKLGRRPTLYARLPEASARRDITILKDQFLGGKCMK